MLALRSPSEPVLKATLSLQPSNLGALSALFEALAAWKGWPVRGVLVADKSSTSFCLTTP